MAPQALSPLSELKIFFRCRIHDFSQGMSYYINGTTGQCSVDVIPANTTFYDSAPSSINPHLVKPDMATFNKI